MPPPSDETGEGQAEPELAVLQAPFKETGVATPEKIKTYFTTVHYEYIDTSTLESGIDVGQGINVGQRKSVKKNKRRA